MTTRTRSHSPPTPTSSTSSTSSNNDEQRLTKKIRLTSPDINLPVASTSKLPYERGLHLAPMVRIGTLPTRLLALEYGAELVWGPEIVAQAIIGSTRIVDPITGTINYMKKDKSVFECHPIEKSRLIFQLGVSDPILAVQAALVVAGDVGGVGLNCGCPKPFSISGGMGAALLKVPDKLCAILKALVKSVPLPIDAKIRLLPTDEDTFSLVSQILETGISALTVHCRTQDMRSSEPALLERLSAITEMGRKKGIPVIQNGDCYGVVDQKLIGEITGVTSMMIARGAESNPSCFRPEGLLDIPTVVSQHYFKLAYLTTNHYFNTKYVLKSMTPLASTNPTLTKSERSQFKIDVNGAKTYEAMAEVLGVDLKELILREGCVEEWMPNWRERLRVEKEGESGVKKQTEGGVESVIVDTLVEEKIVDVVEVEQELTKGLEAETVVVVVV